MHQLCEGQNLFSAVPRRELVFSWNLTPERPSGGWLMNGCSQTLVPFLEAILACKTLPVSYMAFDDIKGIISWLL